MRNLLCALVIAVSCTVLSLSSARGQAASTQGDPGQGKQSQQENASGWSFQLAPYLWIAGLEGDVGVAGLPPVEIDVKFSEILEVIDWFPPPTMLMGKAQNGRFSLFTDFIYLGLEDDGTSPGPLPLSADVDMEAIIWTFGGGYQVLQDGPVTLDLLAGGRLWNMDVDMTFSDPIAVQEGSGSETWVDPFVGIAGHFDLGHGFGLQAEGDIGGFGVGSDLGWQLLGALQYQVTDAINLEAGYRYLSVDYSDSDVLLDFAIHGLFIGGSIRF